MIRIDATNKVFGRLASEIALLLRGKNKPSFQPNITPQEKIIVENIEKIVFTGKKLEQKEYFRYSGYHGGLKTRFLNKEFAKNPGVVFKKTVYDMLPKNKTRDKIIKNLTVE